jgi:hypothetical protein
MDFDRIGKLSIYAIKNVKGLWRALHRRVPANFCDCVGELPQQQKSSQFSRIKWAIDSLIIHLSIPGGGVAL